MNNSVARRPRRPADTGGSGLLNSAHAQSRSESPTSFISACVLFITVVLFFGYLFGNSVFHHSKVGVESLGRKFKPVLSVHSFHKEAPVEEESTASLEQAFVVKKTKAEVQDALPLLQDTYGKYMKNILHIGPGSCDLVARLLRGEGSQAWGIEPSDLEDPSPLCKGLVRKGLVRVAEVHRLLPYRSNSFSLVLATNTLEYLTSRQLNKTLPELGRLTAHAVVAFISAGPGSSEPALSRQLLAGMKSVKHHNRTWWSQRFERAGLEEDEEMTNRFEALRSERSLTISDYVFHLLPRNME